MKYRYIAIEREYGSGGTKIARQLAKECGIPCYGNEILEAVAKKRGVSVDAIQKYEEKTTNSFLYAVYMMGKVQSGASNVLSEEDAIYLDEQEEIRKMAKNGPAIFLGHCAVQALKERSGVLNLYIHADAEAKAARISEDYGIESGRVETVRKWYDKKRSNYYHMNTLKDWKDYKNYDIVMNSSKLGIDSCVRLLKALI